jgi:hypothetical protein
MATVNKDFKIKSGLIVEGTTGTINGEDILTTSQASTDHIVSIVGGTTLVTSVAGNLNVVNGELSIDEVGVATDLAGSRLYTDGSTLNVDGEGLYDDFVSNGMATTTDISTAISNAAGNYDAAGTAGAVASDLSDHIADTSTHGVTGDIVGTSDAQDLSNKTIKGQTYFQSAGGAGGTNNYIDVNNSTGKLRVHSGYALDLTASNDITVESGGGNIVLNADGTSYLTSATSGNEIATKGYVDGLASNYDASGAASQALTDANGYTDTAVANLVDSAPELLNTLNELAAAIADNPNYATDMATSLSNKQDTLTAGTGITLDGATISVTTNTYDAYGAAATAEGNANDYTDTVISNLSLTTSYDAYGAAATAESNANGYTDTAISTEVTNRNSAIDSAINGLNTDDIEEGQNNLYFTNSRVENAMIDPLTLGTQTNISVTYNTGTGAYDFVAENGVADSTTDDLDEGSTNLYFTDTRAVDAITNATIYPTIVDINDYRREEATQTYVSSASTVTVHTFTGNRSVKYLARVVGTSGGTLHSQVTELLVTVDGNNNVAVTEFGSIHTTEPALASFTADYDSLAGFRLQATTAVAGCEVVVAATLLSWAD